VGPFVVKRSLPVEDIGELATELARLRTAVAEVVADGARARYVYSLFIPANRMCLSVIEAADAATVLDIVRRRVAARGAGPARRAVRPAR
jgi:hypothetical protein